MEVLYVVALVVGGGVLVVAVRQYTLYPAHWERRRYTFGLEEKHCDARRSLRQARLSRRAVESESRRRLAEIENRTAEDVKRGEERVRELARQRDELLAERQGDRVGAYGQLVLYEHELHLFPSEPQDGAEPAEPTTKLRLEGLVVERADLRDDCSFIRLSWAGGRASAEYPHQGPYRKREVNRFADVMHTQVKKAEADLARRQREAAALDAETVRIRAATDERKAAGEEAYGRLVDALRPEREEAEAAWNEACDTWRKLAGRRPPWWWRW